MISREELQRVVNDLENEVSFFNRSHLYKAIEQTKWAKSLPRPLTAQVARLKCIEWNIEIKTALGKKGRTVGITNREVAEKLGVRVDEVKKSLQSLPIEKDGWEAFMEDDVLPISVESVIRESVEAEPPIEITEIKKSEVIAVEPPIVEVKQSELSEKEMDLIFAMAENETGRMKIINTISTKRPDNWQDVPTPLDICDEMCGLVPDATHFAVLFSLEFLEILVKRRGVDPKNIVFFGDNKLETAIAGHPKMYGVSTRILDKNAIVVNGVFNQEALVGILKEGIKDMQFGKNENGKGGLCVIQNPPYQTSDGGGIDGGSAVPIYHNFIETIIDELSPDYMVSINPSRWMIGGTGRHLATLDKFRERMVVDKRLKKIVHFSGQREVFPSVSIAGGVNYFLWDKHYNGLCEFIVGNSSTKRDLNQYDVVLQDNNAVDILQKVLNKITQPISDFVSCCSGPFGIRTTYKDWTTSGVKCYAVRGTNYYVGANAFVDKHGSFNKWKVCTSKATSEGNVTPDDIGAMRIISNIFIIEPEAICTETFIVVKTFDTIKEAENFITYMKTKFFRFMLGLRLLTHNISKEKFNWVPDVIDYSEAWTDEELYKKFNLTRQEREYIDSKIKELN